MTETVNRAHHRGTDQHLLMEDRSDWVPDEDLQALAEELGEAVVGLAFEGLPHEAIRYSPCDNVAERFANDVFAVRAFCWCDADEWADDDPMTETRMHCPPNFEHFASGIRGEWYKGIGNCTSFNRDADPEEIARIREECLASLASRTV